MRSIVQNIPNLLTLGNLLCGAIGIERVFAGDMVSAFVLVIVAAILDFFDGFVARWLKVDGDFGKQLDSLADLITFGVLPGLILYHYMMFYGYCYPNGFCTSRYAWVALPAGAAWRLATFNISTNQKTGFLGVPTPINGIAFASLVLVFEPILDWQSGFFKDIYSNFYFLAAAPVIGAWLMVSELPMLAMKFKKGDSLNLWKWILLGGIVGLIILFGRESGPIILLFYVFISLLANFVVSKKING